jgi:hypothetical protein
VDELLNTTSNTPIINPDAVYLAITAKIDISGIPFGTSVDSITDGTLTVTFSTPIEKRGPVPTGWGTWSSPPFSEDPRPDVLFAIDLTTLTMVLSRPVTTFGFELEPDPFGRVTFTADFYSGNTLVESISRLVDGDAGARLFARTGEPIDRVVINGPVDFAIAQVRYTVIPTEILVLLISLFLLLLLSVILIG